MIPLGSRTDWTRHEDWDQELGPQDERYYMTRIRLTDSGMAVDVGIFKDIKEDGIDKVQAVTATCMGIPAQTIDWTHPAFAIGRRELLRLWEGVEWHKPGWGGEDGGSRGTVH